jgi:sigma-B regulation protein RsbU (phosphoserine phosphatase)
MFGTEQLCDIVQQNAFLGANELADLIMAAISDFQAGAEHFDDETLIVLHVNDLPAGNPAN